MLTKKAAVTVVTGLLLAGCAGAAPATTPRAAPSPAGTPAQSSTATSQPPPTRPLASTDLAPPTDPAPSTVAATQATVGANPGGLTDAQMVGQLFVTYVYGSGAEAVTPAQGKANLALYGARTPAGVVTRWHLGGVMLIDHNTLDPARPALSTGNVDSARQIRALIKGLQEAARRDVRLPLLISVDQEGGAVQRIRRGGVTLLPSQARLARRGKAALTCTYARLGRELKALGVNEDYAPVADVVRRPGGVIGDRSFGTDPRADSRAVAAAVAGLQSAGLLATVKHWPGHGGSTTDSHAALAVLPQSAARWRAVDRAPFAAVAGSVAGVMVGHLALPALDPSGRPATLSVPLVRGLLRDGLGYRGLIITDSLWMRPARVAGPPAAVALAALRAGNTTLLMSPDVPNASAAVLSSVRTDLSVRRLVRAALTVVLAAKARLSRAPSSPRC